MSVRVGGAAAILGGLLWTVGLAWAAFDPAESDPGLVVAFVAMIALVVGLTGLSAFQAREHPRLIWGAFVLPAVGSVASIIGMALMATTPDRPIVGDLSAWDIWIVGLIATLVGSMLFAFATYRARVLSRAGALLLGLASALALVMIFSSATGLFGLPDVLALASLAGFSLGWVALGWAGIRVQPADATVAT